MRRAAGDTVARMDRWDRWMHKRDLADFLTATDERGAEDVRAAVELAARASESGSGLRKEPLVGVAVGATLVLRPQPADPRDSRAV
jgi:hypothetical protein